MTKITFNTTSSLDNDLKRHEQMGVSPRLRQIHERYQTLVHENMPDVSSDEINLLKQLCAENEVNSDFIRYLQFELEKSAIAETPEGRALLDKVRAMSYTQRLALIEFLGF